MAFANPDLAIGPPSGGSFDGHNHTPYRAFKWDIGANVGRPIMPTDQNYSGIAGPDGKIWFSATPGEIRQLEVVVAVAQSITAGNLYAINTSGLGTSGAGTAYKALQSATNTGGVGNEFYVILVEVWKPKG